MLSEFSVPSNATWGLNSNIIHVYRLIKTHQRGAYVWGFPITHPPWRCDAAGNARPLPDYWMVIMIEIIWTNNISTTCNNAHQREPLTNHTASQFTYTIYPTVEKRARIVWRSSFPAGPFSRSVQGVNQQNVERREYRLWKLFMLLYTRSLRARGRFGSRMFHLGSSLHFL